MGVVSGCCCEEPYRFPHNNLLLILTPLVLFCSSIPPYFFVNFLNDFFVLVYVILCNIANVAQRTFEIVQKSRSRERGDTIIIIAKNVCRMRARASPETYYFHVQGTYRVTCVPSARYSRVCKLLMYCVYGESRSSLLIESTYSVILILIL